MLKERINSDKLLSIFSKLPLSPNQITLISVLFAVLGFLAFEYESLYSIILFGLAFLFDAIDGVVARAQNKVSNKGAFLDGISDRLVEFFMILTFIVNLGEFWEVLYSSIVVLFFGTALTAYVRAYSHHQGILTEEQAKKLGGSLSRSERVIFLFITLILFTSYVGYGVYLLAFTAFFSVVTFLQRFFAVWNYKN